MELALVAEKSDIDSWSVARLHWKEHLWLNTRMYQVDGHDATANMIGGNVLKYAMQPVERWHLIFLKKNF